LVFCIEFINYLNLNQRLLDSKTEGHSKKLAMFLKKIPNFSVHSIKYLTLCESLGFHSSLNARHLFIYIYNAGYVAFLFIFLFYFYFSLVTSYYKILFFFLCIFVYKFYTIKDILTTLQYSQAKHQQNKIAKAKKKSRIQNVFYKNTKILHFKMNFSLFKEH
jgi:hypothetical protein